MEQRTDAASDGEGTPPTTPRARAWAATTPRYKNERQRDGWQFKCKCCGHGISDEGFCTVCWDANCTETRSRHPAPLEAQFVTTGERSRSAELADAGVRTGVEFADLMTALMGDVLAGRITPSQASAAVGAGSQVLKVIEMSYRHGAPRDDGSVPQIEMPPKSTETTPS